MSRPSLNLPPFSLSFRNPESPHYVPFCFVITPHPNGRAPFLVTTFARLDAYFGLSPDPSIHSYAITFSFHRALAIIICTTSSILLPH